MQQLLSQMSSELLSLTNGKYYFGSVIQMQFFQSQLTMNVMYGIDRISHVTRNKHTKKETSKSL